MASERHSAAPVRVDRSSILTRRPKGKGNSVLAGMTSQEQTQFNRWLQERERRVEGPGGAGNRLTVAE